MCFIYFLDLLLSVIFLYLLLRKYAFAGESILFLIFYAFDRGSSIVIDILLLGHAFRKKFTVTRMHLLLIYSVLEIAGIFVYIIYYGLNGSRLWSEGYIFIIFNAVMAVTYLRRYFFMRDVKIQALTEMEAEK